MWTHFSLHRVQKDAGHLLHRKWFPLTLPHYKK